QTIQDVLHRHKDIQYSSRIATQIVGQQQVHRLRHVISELASRLPEQLRNTPEVRDLAGYGCVTRMHVVTLLAHGSKTKVTARTSISRRRAYARGGTQVTPIQRRSWNKLLGKMNSIQSKASFCTNGSLLTSRREPAARTMAAPFLLDAHG